MLGRRDRRGDLGRGSRDSIRRDELRGHHFFASRLHRAGFVFELCNGRLLEAVRLGGSTGVRRRLLDSWGTIQFSFLLSPSVRVRASPWLILGLIFAWFEILLIEIYCLVDILIVVGLTVLVGLTVGVAVVVVCIVLIRGAHGIGVLPAASIGGVGLC